MGEIQLTFIVLKYKVKVYIYITERERKAPTKVVFALNGLQLPPKSRDWGIAADT